jgi:hypothetical protein
MILIIISWCYILFTVINLGFLFDKVMRLKSTDFIIFSLLGLLSTTLFASIWAIFGRINMEFHFSLLIINVFLFLVFKIQILRIYNNLLLEIGYLKKEIKLLFFFVAILIVAQCAAVPFIIDNETYYVQTIKWLNEYGFVKGLANLHIFLGQTSGWHITQSAFSFSFLYQNFNDLSGFCLLLGNFYAIRRWNLYLKTESIIDLVFGLFLIFNPLLFQFISAPSPDIAVFVISYVLFFLFIDNFEKPTSTLINLQLVLSFFLIYIKPTSIVILIIPIVLLLSNYKTIRSKWYCTAVIGMLFLFLFTIKNTILTGYPLYPTQLIDRLPFDFSIPKELISFYFSEAKLYGFFLTREEFHAMDTYQIFIKWLTVTKINGTFNILSLLIVASTPLFIYKFHSKKAVWIFYFVMLFQLIVLLLTSPQFRFFLNFIIFFSCFIMACLFQKQKKSIYFFVYASTLMALVLVIFPINISALTKNKLFTSTSSFHFTHFIFPSDNSNIKSYTANRLGNLLYYSPDNQSYFWYGGNGKLPCVNKQQLDYFESNFYFIPQKRTSDLKDGFYSKKKSSND